MAIILLKLIKSYHKHSKWSTHHYYLSWHQEERLKSPLISHYKYSCLNPSILTSKPQIFSGSFLERMKWLICMFLVVIFLLPIFVENRMVSFVKRSATGSNTEEKWLNELESIKGIYHKHISDHQKGVSYSVSAVDNHHSIPRQSFNSKSNSPPDNGDDGISGENNWSSKNVVIYIWIWRGLMDKIFWD